MDRMEADFNGRIQAIARLIRADMKMMGQLQKWPKELAQSQEELSQTVKELAAVLKRNDQMLRAFLESPQKCSNGGRSR